MAFAIWTLRSGDNNSARQAFLYISLMTLHDIDYDVNVAKFSELGYGFLGIQIEES